MVTICIPVYNVEKYIEKCCRSLFEQTYENIEYIFVDDCSPDDSIKIIKKILYEYPQRENTVKFIKHKINRGLAAARNTGIDATSGEYILFVDSDDYLDNNTVELLIDKSEKEHADVVIFDTCRIYPNEKQIIRRTVPDTKEETIRKILTHKLAPSVWGKLFKASIIKNNNVKFIEGINVGEDYCTSSRIIYYANKIVHCPDCTYNYVKYNTQSYSNTYQSRNITDIIKAVSILDSFFQSKDDYLKYKDSLDEAKLLIKSKLLINICTHRKNVWSYLPEVSQLYRDVHVNKKILPFKYWITIKLSNLKLFNILYCIIKFKNISKKLIH